jgi:hypothetical protein
MADDQLEYDCSECGSPVAADAITCPQCGARLDEESDGTQVEAATAHVLPPFRHGTLLAYLSIACMTIQILLHLAALGSGWSRMTLYASTNVGHHITQAEGQEVVKGAVLVTTLQVCVFFPAVTVFFMWLYRVCHNLPALGAGGLTHSPRWAVGGFFVPLANLYHPYEVLTEVWKASEPRPLSSGPWQGAKPSLLVKIWWGGCLSTVVLFLVWFINRPAQRQSLDAVLTDITYEMAMEGLGAFILGIGIAMTYAINARQETKHALLSAERTVEARREA